MRWKRGRNRKCERKVAKTETGGGNEGKGECRRKNEKEDGRADNVNVLPKMMK